MQWVQGAIQAIDLTPELYLGALAVLAAFALMSADVWAVAARALRRRFGVPNSRPLSQERRDAITRRLPRDAAAAAGQPALAAPGTARRAAPVLDLRAAGDARGRALDVAGGVLAHAGARPAEGVEPLAPIAQRPPGAAEGHV